MPEEFWFLLAKKLNGDATNAELQQLQQLKLKHPELSDYATIIEENWQNSTLTAEVFDTESAFDRMVSQMPPQDREYFLPSAHSKPSSIKSILKLAVAACLVGLLAASFYFFQHEELTEPIQLNEVTTAPGLKSTITLSDGSEVRLNAGSDLQFPKTFEGDKREVWLTGEAYFVVKKNTKQPFIVHTRDYDVRVTGTEFNVRAYKEESKSETSLIEGGVDIIINKDGNIYQLKPNEKFSHIVKQSKQETGLTNDAEKPVIQAIIPMKINEKINTLPEIAWTKNQLVLQAEDFTSIARKLEYWYGISIEITDARLSREIMSAYFTNESLTEALEILQFITPFKYEIKDQKVIISPI